MKKSGATYARHTLIREAIRRYERRQRAILVTSRVRIANVETCSRQKTWHEDINAIRALISLNEEAIDEGYSDDHRYSG